MQRTLTCYYWDLHAGSWYHILRVLIRWSSLETDDGWLVQVTVRNFFLLPPASHTANASIPQLDPYVQIWDFNQEELSQPSSRFSGPQVSVAEASVLVRLIERACSQMFSA